MQLLNKLALVSLLALGVAGCQTKTQPLQIETRPVELTVIQPADPPPVSMLDVKVKVVTQLNVEEIFKQAAKDQGTTNPVFIVLTTKDYEAIALNLQELKRYILQQQQIITYYKNATAKTQ